MDDDLWLAAPCAAIKLWDEASGLRWQTNDAAREWLRLAGLGESVWESVAQRLRELQSPAGSAGTATGHLESPRLRWVCVPLASSGPGGAEWLIWLSSEMAADAERWSLAAAKLDKALNLAKVSVWHIDAQRNRIVFNDIGYELTGLGAPSGGLDLEQVRATAHPDDVPALVRAAEEAMQRHGVVDVEARYRNLDGSFRHLLTRRVAERDAQGKVVGLMGVSLDLTVQIAERARAEQALRDREAAERASRSKSEFLARISHELRTPLNAVLGFAQLLEHDDAHTLPPLQRERVAQIRSAGEHLLAMLGDVLDLSAIEAGNLAVACEPVPLGEVLRDVATWLAPLAQSRQVAIRIEATDGSVNADPQRLRQIVLNLTSDAIKYSHADGTVWLQTRASAEATSPGWHICIRDDGRGLTATEREHLADSFARLAGGQGVVEGAGIGLTIVRRLAEVMGGRVDVVEPSGPGSEFRVWMPAAAAPAAPIGRHEDPERAPALTILYIEDNPVNVVLVRELVAMRPEVDLVCAVNGLNGVASALADRPDVVLIDMQLPDIDGYEVLKRLRARPELAASSMIALSANGMSDDIARAKSAGFDDYWTKPIDFRRFLAQIDALSAAKAAKAAPRSAVRG